MPAGSSRARRVWRWVVAAGFLSLWSAGGSERLVSQQEPFAEEERITAVDVLVEIVADRERRKPRELPEELEASRFEIRVDGEPRTVVGVFDPRYDTGEVRPEPWSLVLYFDLSSSAASSLRWAADELAEMAAELAALGEVEIVVADPWPLRRLAPTRDAGLLAETLSGLMLDAEGGHEILERRSLFLEALAAATELPGGEQARGLADEEASLIGRQLDALLTSLAQRGTNAAGRAVFFLHDGFDLEPEGFYRSRLGVVEDPAVRARTRLRERARAVAETLAGYGWTVVSLAAPERGPGLVPGLRLGKWRLMSLIPPPGALIGGAAVREHQREPETAESFLLLGEARLDAGDVEQAREAFEQALYHFAGDPRTALRQAAAHEALGRALLAEGRPRQAREAFSNAVALDRSWAYRYPGADAAFSEPLAPLEMLAGETSGRVVRDAEALAEAITSLEQRLRLTYQFAGPPQGRNFPLEVRLVERDPRSEGPELELRHPRWARSGTPETVAAARARRVLAGDSLDGDLPLWVDFVAAAVRGQETGLILELDLTAAPSAWRELPDHPFRITVAHGDLERQTVRHHLVEAEIDPANPLWTWSVEAADLGEDEAIAVVIEDLEAGLWGVGAIEPRS